jgi:hypothetical protein
MRSQLIKSGEKAGFLVKNGTFWAKNRAKSGI